MRHLPKLLLPLLALSLLQLDCRKTTPQANQNANQTATGKPCSSTFRAKFSPMTPRPIMPNCAGATSVSVADISFSSTFFACGAGGFAETRAGQLTKQLAGSV